MKPSFECLEDRWVPSAVVLDLTTRGSEGMINDAVFTQCDAQPTGTGYIRSFLRVQAGGNGSVEQGFNTDARPLTLNENKSPQFTRSLQLGTVPLVSKNGVLYREFLLDINQSASNPLLSLDELRIYVGGAPNLSGYDATAKTLADLTPVFDMDVYADNWVRLNYRLNAGSGAGDIYISVPASNFGSDGSQYVYLYSRFGDNLGANAGFEEFAVRTIPDDDNPPPSAPASLSGYVFHDRNEDGVRDAGDTGILGAIVQLQGTNDLGQTVVLTATTDENGFYRFENLRAGIYSLLEVQPEAFHDGMESVGTQGGSLSDDRIFDIFLAAGVDGEENNFAELLFMGS